MRYVLDAASLTNFEVASRKEWLLTNGIGGFAMGTASGANQRRYHGHLVAAIEPPTNRMVLLANIECSIQGTGAPIALSSNQYQGAVHPEGYQYLQEFIAGEDVHWVWRVSGLSITKRLALTQGVNAVTVQYENNGALPFLLTLRPLVSHKPYHGNSRYDAHYPRDVKFEKSRTVIEHEGVRLFLNHTGARRMPVAGWYYRFEHLRELERGLEAKDDLFCPCEIAYELSPGERAVIVASDFDGAIAEEFVESVPAKDFRTMLVDATKPFFVRTKRRSAIIAGYPWFTDWGRDTMICIPGLCLSTERTSIARQIISDYLWQMRQGLIPNRFADDGDRPEYNTVDATLWCVNAIYKCLRQEWNQEFAEVCYEKCKQVFEWHVRGTFFGIKVDPTDGFVTQGKDGVQLTWMDAKIGDWVVTPRHGKPVEIAGLWINALRCMAWLAEKLKHDSSEFSRLADLAQSKFESTFWHPSVGHYLDTADPADGSFRPNQLIPMSLPFPICNPKNARIALQKIARELLTECGLRTLSPDDPSYKGRFRGPLPELDAAYHQGTVWPWLLGSFCTAWVRYFDDKVEAKRILKQARSLLNDVGMGGISEVYDGDKPRLAGGCPWQAWSVAEILRAWDEDEL